MMKKIIAMVAIAAAFTMASCNKEQIANSGEDVEGNCIVTASTEGNLTKTTLSGDDAKGYEVVWSEGDIFKLRNETFTLVKGAGTASGIFKGHVSAINSKATAYYPASFDGSNWPTEQTYTEGNITDAPMMAEVYCFMGKIDGGKVEFKNAGGILRLTVKGTGTVKSIKVSVDGLDVITLNCGEGVELDNTDGSVFHIAMPAGAYSHTEILFTAVDRKCCLKTLKPDKPLVINSSEITPASIKIDKWTNNSRAPEGALSGTFTVADDGNGNVRKVYFSKGNLYWDGNIYGFENNQYDINVVGHQSSFFWSNKAEYARGTEWNLDFNAPMAFFTNADEVTANPGFTANGQTELWRTLSKDEWTYLINRKNGIGEATINGVKGVIIFHDDYDDQTDGLTSIPEGCVFLPAGRDGGVIALYWSSTSLLNPSSYIPTAAALRYEDGAWPPYVVSDGMPEKNTVRLVTDVPADASFTVTFDMNGKTGTAPAAITGVKFHTTISQPTEPVVEGEIFLGWYKDKKCTVKWNFESDYVTSDITLYAKWQFRGALLGTFTVNESGKKVYFSKGNLWYGKTSEEAKSATFNFEENQFGYSVSGNKESGFSRDNNHVSHFMWSKNAEIAIKEKYNDPGRTLSDVLFTNATKTTPNSNFTVNGQNRVWRALSNEEWKYLVDHNGSVWATINGIGGRIIFCDEYSGNKECEFTEIPEGCLFLPAVGWRKGETDFSNDLNSINNLGEIGYYLCSTQDGSGYAYRFEFDVNSGSSKIYDVRSEAYSIRLVADVK